MVFVGPLATGRMTDTFAASFVEKRVSLNGRGSGALSYLDFGNPARALDFVFLHANGFNALTYRHVLGSLAKDWRFAIVDQRGHGATTLETDVSSRRDWVDLRDDLLAFLDVLGVERVILAGHSMGATTSLLAAAARPERCKRLVLFDPVIMPRGFEGPPEDAPIVVGAKRRRAIFSSRAEAMKAYRGRGAFASWPDPILADYVSAGFRDRPDGQVELACAPEWEASGFAAQGHDPWTAFDECICPIRVVRAESGSTFRVDDLRRSVNHPIEIETPPGSTHLFPMIHADMVASRLRAALAEAA